METGNIYHDGVVLILQTSCWGTRKKLPEDRINVSADPKFVSGTKAARSLWKGRPSIWPRVWPETTRTAPWTWT